MCCKHSTEPSRTTYASSNSLSGCGVRQSVKEDVMSGPNIPVKIHVPVVPSSLEIIPVECTIIQARQRF